MFECIAFNEEQYKREANDQSWTHAVGWSGLFNGFAGKTTKKISPVDLLPFPDLLKPKNRISRETARTLISLIKNNKLRPKVISALSPIINEAIELAKEQ